MMANMEQGPISQETRLGDLPPELLEVVLGKLDEGRNSMLPYRLVNSEWKSIIDSLSEKRVLSKLTKWVPHITSPNVWYKPVPKVSVLNDYRPGSHDDEIEWRVKQPPSIQCSTSIQTHKGNPFPSNSLHIWQGENFGDQNSNPRIHLHKLLIQFGHHLTSLVLEYVCWKPTTLFGILNLTKSLKFLRLDNISVYNDGTLPPSNSKRSLRHLKFLHLKNNRPFLNDMNEQLQHWFLKPYVYQLTQLEFHGPEFPQFQGTFKKLKQLKIWYPQLSVLRHCPPAPLLQRLSILCPCSDWGGNIYHVTNFIDKFATSLVNQHMYVMWNGLIQTDALPPSMRYKLNFNSLDGSVDPRETDGKLLPTAAISFPNLKKLTMNYPDSHLAAKLVRKTFLPKFPELEKLHLLYFYSVVLRNAFKGESIQESKAEIVRDFLEQENYWSSCPKLMQISVVDCQNPDADVILVINRPN